MPSKKKAASKPARSAEHKNMIVIASGERPIKEVTADLKKAGFKVDQVMDAIGQVTGSAVPSLQKKLKGIKGVADVTGTHEDFNIGPPGAPVS